MDSDQKNYWRRKLDAYLHDPVSKALDIPNHLHNAEALKTREQFTTEEYFSKDADHFASAADRLPWPHYKRLASPFDGSKSHPFKHPLDGADIVFEKGMNSELALEISHRTNPVLNEESDPRAAFIARWRFWKNWASDLNPLLSCLPAETRLPDHTIWNHLSVTAALEGCRNSDGNLQPALLLFSIGPVQEFIAAARSTRDLLSGSYLLSYVIAKALAYISLTYGPDHVIFPNILNQPLVDLHMQPFWQKLQFSEAHNVWDSFGYDGPHKHQLLTPTLPNRFLAVLPAWEAEQVAAELTSLVKDQIRAIGDRVKEAFQQVEDFDRARFDRQLDSMLQVYWQVTPIPDSFDEVEKWAKQLPAGSASSDDPTSGWSTIQEMVQKMPPQHRDSRYFEGDKDNPGQLRQVSAAWSVIYALSEWQMAAVKNTRLFDAWDGSSSWSFGRENNKDSLNGKEEAIIQVGHGEEVDNLQNLIGINDSTLFRSGERLGASTLLKRFWLQTWMCDEHKDVLAPEDFSMPNTYAIARGKPFDKSQEENHEDEAAYYAVIALDGDQMGQWISGAKCPELRKVLSKEALDYFQEPLEERKEKITNPLIELLSRRRPLSPSFHLQFSELLTNFSLVCVRRIVEAYYGRLIYAGGDDVLAMLPAKTAMSCAYALRQAFRGDNHWLAYNTKGIWEKVDLGKPVHWPQQALFDPMWNQPGSIRLHPDLAPSRRGETWPILSEPYRFPVLVPGPATDCSAGIAIGHVKAPLQDMIRAAQLAEKRAKRGKAEGGMARSAVAVSLHKGSGERIEWAYKWDSTNGMDTPFSTLLEALQAGSISARFPHKLLQVLQPYRGHPNRPTQADTVFMEGWKDIIQQEFDHTLKRSCKKDYATEAEAHSQRFGQYLSHLEALYSDLGTDQERLYSALRNLDGFLQTLAWIARGDPLENSHTQPVVENARA